MNQNQPFLFLILLLITFTSCKDQKQDKARSRTEFTDDWRFSLKNKSEFKNPQFQDSTWRLLDLPHDWSIEGEFSEDHPTTPEGGALPTGIGWYRKTFKLPEKDSAKSIFIDFDGVYRNSTVYINGHKLGTRPNGYISFRYNLTPYLNYGDQPNVLAVKVDNSGQPNSRWYTGSGIYRNVWLVKTGRLHVDHWGTFITTPEVNEDSANVKMDIKVRNRTGKASDVTVKSALIDSSGNKVASRTSEKVNISDSLGSVSQQFTVDNPDLWSVKSPSMYKAVTSIYHNDELLDQYETPFGIRTFRFDAKQGFFLNGESMKIRGVCKHHDLGPLGAAMNKRALERQLQMFKEMGVNAIRTAHNPPSPELLELCNHMGFIVMDEAFDVWKKKKVDEDYHIFWDDWYEKDLRDQIKRDRNHPSVMIWSIGNEIREQFDSTGIPITRDLVSIVKSLDTTRPVTCALTENKPEKNHIYQSGALDLLGFNYKHKDYSKFPDWYPGEKLIASENMCAMATRGRYNMPSDSIRRWPPEHEVPIPDPNPDHTISSYDNVSAYWGSTHRETLKEMKGMDYMAGMFVWSGIDYLGEPMPYGRPGRSSYWGVIDLAGFPKDAFYLYKSEWTNKTVLHILPHWNWEPGKTVDVWAYYNNADQVELFLNGESLGKKAKEGNNLRVKWQVEYKPGTLKAVSYKDGDTVMTRTVKTAGKSAQIQMEADRNNITADGDDLSFITVNIHDKEGNFVPKADNKVHFEAEGPGKIVGVANGYPASHEPMKADYKSAFSGKCLAVIQSEEKAGEITVKATSDGLKMDSLTLTSK